ncbi:retrotransposon protein, putative, ty3-gypsy subclass [Tanacetum coccineum]
MSANVARGHGGDGDGGGGGDDRPPPHQTPTGCGCCLGNRGPDEAEGGGPSKDWASNFIILLCLFHYRTQFDLKPHMESERWTKIHTGIQQHLQKIYNGNKAALKDDHWVQNPETRTYDVESIRRGRPANIFTAYWDAQISFWNDPKNLVRCAQNRKNRAKSTVVCRQGSRSLGALRDQMMESSATREYPSLIQTFFQTHTVGGVFLRDEDRALYEEMLKLQGLGSNTETGVTTRWLESSHEFGSASGSGRCGDDESGDDEDGGEDEEDEDADS